MFFGLDPIAIGASLVVGLVVDTIAMWLVASYLLSIPGIQFKMCAKAAVMLIIVTAVMFAASFLFGFIPVIGRWVWLMCFFGALKAAIEGSLDVPSGGDTILFLYILIQAMLIYFMNQLFGSGDSGAGDFDL